MRGSLPKIRGQFDRAGVWLSGLCVLHCVAGLVLVSVLGLGGGLLLAPEIHEVGLALAIVIGLASLGYGMRHHRQAGPLALGALGLALMAGGLAVEHGPYEALLTIIGVALLAAAHLRNLHLAR